MGVGLQPPLAALLLLTQRSLAVIGPVGSLGGHRQPTRHRSGLVAAAAQNQERAARLAAAELLVSR